MKIAARWLICVTLLTATLIASTPARAQFFFMQNPNVGKPAPDFTLMNLEGEKVTMSDYKGDDRAIIFFWATWCPHCRESLAELNKTYASIEEKDIKLVIVDLGESRIDVRRYVDRNNIQLPIFLDTESSLVEPYALIGVPTFYFVDEQGIIRAVKHTLPDEYESLFAKK